MTQERCPCEHVITRITARRRPPQQPGRRRGRAACCGEMGDVGGWGCGEARDAVENTHSQSQAAHADVGESRAACEGGRPSVTSRQLPALPREEDGSKTLTPSPTKHPKITGNCGSAAQSRQPGQGAVRLRRQAAEGGRARAGAQNSSSICPSAGLIAAFHNVAYSLSCPAWRKRQLQSCRIVPACRHAHTPTPCPRLLLQAHTRGGGRGVRENAGVRLPLVVDCIQLFLQAGRRHQAAATRLLPPSFRVHNATPAYLSDCSANTAGVHDPCPPAIHLQGLHLLHSALPAQQTLQLVPARRSKWGHVWLWSLSIVLLNSTRRPVLLPARLYCSSWVWIRFISGPMPSALSVRRSIRSERGGGGGGEPLSVQVRREPSRDGCTSTDQRLPLSQPAPRSAHCHSGQPLAEQCRTVALVQQLGCCGLAVGNDSLLRHTRHEGEGSRAGSRRTGRVEAQRPRIPTP